MTVERMQELIDRTNYWDLRVLDINAYYFGDEIDIFIGNDKDKYWKISFLSCYSVSYETDADRRMILNVKKMRKNQLGYFVQDIIVSESDISDFYKTYINLTIMEMEIECRDISIEQISKNDVKVFWENN